MTQHGASETIRLITRGDDAGCCRSANRAIRAAFQQGILRNVSVMAPAPELEDAADQLANLQGLCAGLHVTLNCEWDRPKWGPVLDPADVPALVDQQGHLLTNPKDLHERNAPLEQMIAEVRAQLDLARQVGFDIRYIDQHMGVGWVNGLDEAITELARQEGLIKGSSGPWRRFEKIDKDLPPHRRLAQQLATAQPGTYLVVGHPLLAEDADAREICREGNPPGSIADDRENQRLMFMDQAVLDVVKRRDIQPIRYDQQ